MCRYILFHKVKVTWEDGKMKSVSNPKETNAKTKPSTFYREIVGDELLLVSIILHDYYLFSKYCIARGY